MNGIRPILKYPGGKWKQAEWIIAHMPEHHTYVEPYFGSGAVFFKKPPSRIETINDLDSRVINLFKVIRDHPELLMEKIALTPYSRYVYDESYNNFSQDDGINDALKFLIQCWQGYSFRLTGKKVGWKNDLTEREYMYAVRNWNRLPGWIKNIIDRLKCVQIENRPALEVIKRHNHDSVLMYIDPPYLLDNRAKQYQYEMEKEDHIALLHTLKESKAKIIISGYDNSLYNDMLSKWDTDTVESLTEHGGKRIEKIWCNFKIVRQFTIDDYISTTKLMC